MNLYKEVNLTAGKNFNAVVEIPKDSRIKYEYDEKKGYLKLSRILHTAFAYPFNYGFFPQTYARDGDAFDILILGDSVLAPLTVVEVRPIGLLRMHDVGMIDDKVLAVPVKDPNFKSIRTLTDIPDHILREVKHFFAHYKDLEKVKTKTTKWCDARKAVKEIKQSAELYNKKIDQST